ncbi:hypothetical protein A8B78_22320 [Jannaschia sp. EhC01]|nr:hypothetical protein A8B78_22320 [Jannaschia sp. EhC01]
MIAEHEQRHGLRKRKRRSKDQEVFERAVDAIISDLALNALTEHSSGIRISRSNGTLLFKSRYRSPVTTKTLPMLLDLLSGPSLGLIEQKLGIGSEFGDGIQTIIRPLPKLVDMLQRYRLCPLSFVELQRKEPIHLKGNPLRHDKPAPQIEYEDSDITERFRRDVQEINAWLATAQITSLGPLTVDLNRRQLRRVFTRGSFSKGGRLFGGFWQPMHKLDRLKYLEISGEPVVEIDYGQIMPRLMYAHAGIKPEMDDLYAISGFAAFRPGVKKIMSSMLFVDKPITRFPKGTRNLFPKGVSVCDVTDAVSVSHPNIAQYFFTGIGHHCQFLESQIMVEVLRVLMGMKSMGIIALPIHDAVLVPASAEKVVKNVMLHTFLNKTGQSGVVDVLTKQQLEETDAIAA